MPTGKYFDSGAGSGLGSYIDSINEFMPDLSEFTVVGFNPLPSGALDAASSGFALSRLQSAPIFQPAPLPAPQLPILEEFSLTPPKPSDMTKAANDARFAASRAALGLRLAGILGLIFQPGYTGPDRTGELNEPIDPNTRPGSDPEPGSEPTPTSPSGEPDPLPTTDEFEVTPPRPTTTNPFNFSPPSLFVDPFAPGVFNNVGLPFPEFFPSNDPFKPPRPSAEPSPRTDPFYEPIVEPFVDPFASPRFAPTPSPAPAPDVFADPLFQPLPTPNPRANPEPAPAPRLPAPTPASPFLPFEPDLIAPIGDLPFTSPLPGPGGLNAPSSPFTNPNFGFDPLTFAQPNPQPEADADRCNCDAKKKKKKKKRKQERSVCKTYTVRQLRKGQLVSRVSIVDCDTGTRISSLKSAARRLTRPITSPF
jgi:hypothetical protein